jgi:alkanesulfonate monooxygenase SsuD/methylene tetrahydromethanopterin reductase-like flavin-dependent oxidoreductase (luciferase family)
VGEHTHLPGDYLPTLRAWKPDHVDLIEHLYDPFVALAAAATATTRLVVGTAICAVTLHNPITLAKQVATLDVLSAGRFVFGVGTGWIPQELAHHGSPFDDRFALMRERVLAMKAI